MDFVGVTRRKFVAVYLGDLSKAIFAVALASRLFVDLALWLRVALASAGILLFVTAYFIHPENKGGKND